ncbi:MAG: PD-(D/E)XK nuclease family protein [Bacteroidetes bacterium]|nr:PD-(D/E)XK nuclease family protein [Bacteroidota bacterium]
MQSFLEKTVDYLHQKYGDDISELCIVLPNRRAGLFLKTHFSKKLKKTFWSPEILATEDFVSVLAELEVADSTTLLFELYETVKTIGKREIETFDEFSKWGQILLSDFNELDRYLVDSKQLFGNLKDIKELEAWSLNSEETLTDFQKQYLEFWKLLGEYYEHFTKRLLEQHQAYQGLAYRIVADCVEERVGKYPWKKIIFAGFNALNKAEEEIIEKLLNADKAEIIWDTDSYYVNNVNQEAGRFIRKYKQSGKFSKALPSDTSIKNITIEETLLSAEQKSITVIGAAKNIAQAKVAGSLINEIKKTDPLLQETAIVLADENLLFPVLHSLPENLKDINVTMGYPLKNTPVAGYFDLIFAMHETGLKLAQGKSNYSFYHSDIIKLLSHAYSATALGVVSANYPLRKVLLALQQRNIVFANLKMLKGLFVEFDCEKEYDVISGLFKHWETPADAIACVHYTIEILKDGIVLQQGDVEENKASLELEYLFAFTKIIKRIQVLMEQYPESVGDLKTFRSLVNQIVRTSTLPFYGEPLLGLQVMGMLETRTLDFKNVILLSCNEDILPSGKAVNSFIPFELKRVFGLPTYGDKDSIFSYHFYRLLQRATNIHLLYNTESDALGSGEKSRFLTQLIYELPKVNPNVTITETLVSIPIINNGIENVISIEKSEAIREKLKAKAEYGFSPSLLNIYRNCSLQFYFHAIAGLKEADEIEETIGADTLGNVIHEALESFYKPFVGKKIQEADIKEMKKLVESTTITLFKKEFSDTEVNFGKNLLTIKVALKFIHNFLDAEIKNIQLAEKNATPIIIKALETELESVLSIAGQEVKIKGKADRVDSVGSLTRIVDYKTGIADNKELKFDEWDELRTNTTLAKSFQLLTYAWLYQKMNPAIQENIVSGIITFRELSAGLKTVKVNESASLNINVLAEYEKQLVVLMTEIFDGEHPFVQTKEKDHCEYCAFKGVCNR